MGCIHEQLRGDSLTDTNKRKIKSWFSGRNTQECICETTFNYVGGDVEQFNRQVVKGILQSDEDISE